MRPRFASGKQMAIPLRFSISASGFPALYIFALILSKDDFAPSAEATKQSCYLDNLGGFASLAMTELRNLKSSRLTARWPRIESLGLVDRLDLSLRRAQGRKQSICRDNLDGFASLAMTWPCTLALLDQFRAGPPHLLKAAE